MDQQPFQRILFHSAMCVMACDGEIHDSEITELEVIAKKPYYFSELEFNSELEKMLNDFVTNEKNVVLDYFNELEAEFFLPTQSLQILEIILRIIHADNRIDPNEIKFLKIVKSKLQVSNEIFLKRFGDVSYLSLNHQDNKVYESEEWVNSEVDLPDFSHLKTTFDAIKTGGGSGVDDINFQFNKDDIAY